jgi:uncharacterized SAM-binding protein YcdF (DUF218 family)
MARNLVSSPQLRERWSDWPQAMLATSALFVVTPVAATYAWQGKASMEKLLTAMAQPFFLLMLCLILVAMILSWRGQRSMSRLLLLGTAALWCASCPMLVGRLQQMWESQIAVPDLSRMEPLDCVVVLGGGCGVGPNDRPQLGESGDRVIVAARLFHLGLTKKLVATGDPLEVHGVEKPTSPDASEITRTLWVELGIPNASIDEIGGQNTSSEMKALSDRPDLWNDRRCGLVTSAFHMPRALRLAKRNGMETLIPIGSDFRTVQKDQPWLVEDIMPNAQVLHGFHRLAKEWIAAQIGR